MKKLALSIVTGALLLAGVPAVQATQRTADVLVKDDFFQPKRTYIRKGGTVTWRWRGDNPHNVALKRPNSSRVYRRSRIKIDGRYSFQFGRIGTWRIVCEVHPDDMRGRVIVRSS